MKKKIIAALPFAIIPAFIPLYSFLDSMVLVEIFGCGCVPSAQTNMLNIPFNANDLRLAVFSALTVALSVWSGFIAKNFKNKIARIIYFFGAVLFNILLTAWYYKTAMWM